MTEIKYEKFGSKVADDVWGEFQLSLIWAEHGRQGPGTKFAAGLFSNVHSCLTTPHLQVTEK